MHTDLSPHLHTPECNKLIDQLKNCHSENKFGRFIGACNEIDSAVVKCLKQERIARSSSNRAKSFKRQEEIKAKIRATDPY